MISTILATLLLTAPIATATPQETQIEQTAAHAHKAIDTATLKSWYEQNKTMTVLDARSKEYFDGTLLPNAKWLSAESSSEEIQAALPSKESLIVVYCAGTKCPASGYLADNLAAMGYTNVYEYSEGMEGWMKKDILTTKQ